MTGSENTTNQTENDSYVDVKEQIKNRRGFLQAFGVGVGAGVLATLGVLRFSQGADGSQQTPDREPATVSVELEPEDSNHLPFALSVTVDGWGDADAVRILQPDSVPSIRTIDPDQSMHFSVLDNLDVTAGIMVESVHGDWRTTIAKRWIHGDPPHLENEVPGHQESARWSLKEMNETEADNAE